MSVVYLDRGSPLPRRGTPRGEAINLDVTTPTLLVERLLDASLDATSKAADPLNLLDNNPFISREWLIVSQGLWNAAREMERRFTVLFDEGTPYEIPLIPAPNLPRLPAGSSAAAASDDVSELRREATALKKVVAELVLENQLLKRRSIRGS